MKKEEALKKIEEFERTVDENKEYLDKIRKRLASVLGLYQEKSSPYYTDTEREIEDLSFEELFFEIGKRIGYKETNHLQAEVKAMYERLDFLENKLNKRSKELSKH